MRRAVRPTLVLTRRHLLHLFRIRGLALWSTAQPIMFLLLFTFVFGGVISRETGHYITFVVPGIVTQFLALTVFATAIGVHTDISQGLIDRFRSLPIARSAVLSGRIFSDALRCAFNIVVIIVVGALLGFRCSTGPVPIVGAFLLAIAFGVALAWVGAWIGLTVRSVETVNTVGTIWVVPLMFFSSLFVPTHTLPGWLQPFVKINPLSSIADALRALTLGGATTTPVLTSLAWTTGILITFATLAVRQYRRLE
jgi:ABC transporter DrrB family efflux protein